MGSDKLTVERSPSALSASVEKDVVLMDIDSGDYFELAGSGARIWSLLDQPRSIDEICDCLTREFAVDAVRCRTETIEFVRDLQQRGLVVVSGDQ
jgi:hypothetical protein